LNHAEIIFQLKNGNNAVFENIVGLWQDKVYNTALSIIQNEHDAEDITQDVFVSLYERIGSFKEESGLSTWIYRITVNRSLDHEKKRKREKRGGLLRKIFSISSDDEPVNFDHPGIVLDNKERATVLFAAIKRLPDKQRLAFTLQKMEGLGNKEIAAIMETSLFAVESLQIRAKTKLRQILEVYYQQNL